MIFIYLGSILMVRGRLGWAATTKMGPNYASGVVWALHVFAMMIQDETAAGSGGGEAEGSRHLSMLGMFIYVVFFLLYQIIIFYN